MNVSPSLEVGASGCCCFPSSSEPAVWPTGRLLGVVRVCCHHSILGLQGGVPQVVAYFSLVIHLKLPCDGWWRQLHLLFVCKPLC